MNFCRTGEFDRRVWYSTNCWRRMVRQDPANRAPKHPDRNGTEGAAKGVHRHLGLLSRVPLWTAPGRAQEHHHHLRCGLRDRWLLRFQPGVRSSWWVFLLRHARECRLSIDLHRAFQDFSSLKEFRAKMIKTIKSSKKKKRKKCVIRRILRETLQEKFLCFQIWILSTEQIFLIFGYIGVIYVFLMQI